MATIPEFIELVASEVGSDANKVTYEFKDNKMIIEIEDLDEDAFDEDESVDLDDAEDAN